MISNNSWAKDVEEIPVSWLERKLENALTVLDDELACHDYLGGFPRPTIADLSCVCEIVQLELLDTAGEPVILPKNVARWKADMMHIPHAQEVNADVEKFKAYIKKRQRRANM